MISKINSFLFSFFIIGFNRFNYLYAVIISLWIAKVFASIKFFVNAPLAGAAAAFIVTLAFTTAPIIQADSACKKYIANEILLRPLTRKSFALLGSFGLQIQFIFILLIVITTSFQIQMSGHAPLYLFSLPVASYVIFMICSSLVST